MTESTDAVVARLRDQAMRDGNWQLAWERMAQWAMQLERERTKMLGVNEEWLQEK